MLSLAAVWPEFVNIERRNKKIHTFLMHSYGNIQKAFQMKPGSAI